MVGKPSPRLIGAAVLAVATGTIVAALAFEHFGGHAPCPLCLQQRYAYYFSIPACGLALALLTAGWSRAAAALFLLVALAFLANTGLGAYQAGAEWTFWPGPDSCAGSQDIAARASDLVKGLSETRVARCDEASWRFLGLSFAGWNAVVSFFLSFGGLIATAEAARRK